MQRRIRAGRTWGLLLAALLALAAGTAAAVGKAVERPEGVGRLNVVRVDLPAEQRTFTEIARIPVIGPMQARCGPGGQATLRFRNLSGQRIHSYLDKGGANPVVEEVANGRFSSPEGATARDLWLWRIASEGQGVPWRISTQVIGVHETAGACSIHLNWHSFPTRPGQDKS